MRLKREANLSVIIGSTTQQMGEQHKYNKKLISGEISRVLVRAIKHASKQDNQYNVISITGSPFYLLQTWKYKYDAR